jgi:RNAse (barnase) inhibitor barstar
MELQSKLESILVSASLEPVLILSHANGVAQTLETIAERLGFCFVHLSGLQVVDKSSLLEVLAERLMFPSYFGHNWDALLDSLRDLEWIPAQGYIVLYENPSLLYQTTYEDLVTFLEIVISASEFWSDRQVPFHLFLTEGEALTKLQHDERIQGRIQVLDLG